MELLGINTKIIPQKQNIHVPISILSLTEIFSRKMRLNIKQDFPRTSCQNQVAVFAVSSGIKYNEVSSSNFQEFSVTRGTSPGNEVKISVQVSGAKTQTIFDDVFSQMVADAQPIPGFRRVKGGKTPDIPRDILLEVLGPSKVYKQVIKKIINFTISEYAEKESLAVSKDLRIEQSFEDLEDAFEPGHQFNFDAVVQLQ